MKRMLLVLSLITVICSFASAQSVDPRLRVKYTDEYLQDMAQNSPNELKYLNWYLDNSFRIIDITPEKCEYLPYLKHFDPETKTIGDNVTDVNQEDFNVFYYSFERKYDKPTTYRIGSSGKAIVFFSQKDLASNFNKHQNFK